MFLAPFVVKDVQIFANVVISLAGLALVGVGIAVLVQFSDLVELVPEAINSIPIAVIVVGAVGIFIALFGCCGAIKESRCLLIMYSVCMLILAAVKIYLAAVIFRSLSDIYKVVEPWIQDAFDHANLTEAFHVVEAAFQCCGVSGPGTYDSVHPALPPTCCVAPTDGGVSTCAAGDAYGGCANIVANWFSVYGDAVAIVLITVAVVEVVLILGINGACRAMELYKIKNDRSFVITEVMDNLIKIYTLRLDHVKSNKFISKYINNNCARKIIGRNTIATMPNKIATSFNLEDPGHRFQRTSATLPADSGADLLVVNWLGGWKLDQVAEGYIEDSLQKQDFTKSITKNTLLKIGNKARPRITVNIVNCPNMVNVTYNFPCQISQSLFTNLQHCPSLELPVFFTPKSTLSASPIFHDVSVLNLHPSAMSPQTPLLSPVDVSESQQLTTTTNISPSHTITGSSYFTQLTDIGASMNTITITMTNCANMTNVAFNFPCDILSQTENTAMTHSAPNQQSQSLLINPQHGPSLKLPVFFTPKSTLSASPLSHEESVLNLQLSATSTKTPLISPVNVRESQQPTTNILSSHTLTGSSFFTQQTNIRGPLYSISITITGSDNMTDVAFNFTGGKLNTHDAPHQRSQSLFTNPQHGPSLELPVLFPPESPLSASSGSDEVSVLNLQPSAMSPQTPLTSPVNVRKSQQPTTATNTSSSHTITGSSSDVPQTNISGPVNRITCTISNCPNMTKVTFNFLCDIFNNAGSTINVTLMDHPNLTNETFNYRCN